MTPLWFLVVVGRYGRTSGLPVETSFFFSTDFARAIQIRGSVAPFDEAGQFLGGSVTP
jgi:hypothetical protein